VVYLVAKTATEPLYQPAPRHISRGRHLQFPEVRAGVGVVDRHAVVAEAEDEGQEKAAHHLRSHEVDQDPRKRHVAEHESAVPQIVKEKPRFL